MEKILRIKCPDLSLTRDERIDFLFEEIDRWISSNELCELVNLFGGNIDKSLSIKDRINLLNEFSDIWDYRKIQAGGGERWDIFNDDFVDLHSEEILNLTSTLGLKDITTPEIAPDYILPLGGARLANLVRCQQAKEIVDNIGDNIKVVALGGKRPLNEIEKEYTVKYSPNAGTEFDALNSGLEIAFGLEGTEYTENGYSDLNPNYSWAIRKYNSGMELYSVAAPSSDPNRRANSIDTFEFFMKKFSINKGTKLLLVTSSIYVPFQFLKFMSLAINNDLYIDCVGVVANFAGVQFSKTSNFLQETKATINVMKALSDEFL